MDMNCTDNFLTVENNLRMDMNCTNDTMPMTMVMTMTFQFTKSGTVLFDGWSFSTVGGLIGSMIGIFVLAFGYEALKFLRAYLLTAAIDIRQKNRNSGDERFTQQTILSKSHLIQTALYGIQAIVSYFLMLVFMTYNGWLCIAVAVGLVCGYFLFWWNSSIKTDVNEDQSTILSKSHLIQTALYGIQVIISYFLMLIFMTYNAWLCIALVDGLLFGYFIFGWRTPTLNDDKTDHSS